MEQQKRYYYRLPISTQLGKQFRSLHRECMHAEQAAERFAKMKPTAVFINCGRGNAVSAEVLYDVLQKKIIRAAACDVFEQEPLPSDSPLWSLENLVITPHTAGGFHLPDTKDKIIAIAAQNIRAVLGKAEYRNIIDFSTGYKK